MKSVGLKEQLAEAHDAVHVLGREELAKHQIRV